MSRLSKNAELIQRLAKDVVARSINDVVRAVSAKFDDAAEDDKEKYRALCQETAEMTVLELIYNLEHATGICLAVEQSDETLLPTPIVFDEPVSSALRNDGAYKAHLDPSTNT